MTKRVAAFWTCLVLASGTAGCSLYFEPGHGEGGSGSSDAGQPVPLPPPDGPEPAPPPDGPEPVPPPDGGQCTGLAEQPVILDCATQAGYEVNSWRSDSVGPTALHLVSVYETRSDHAGGVHPEGEARVEFSLPGENVLAVAAYEPTHWNITLAPGASLQKIVAIGYHAQRVTAPPGVVVETHDYETSPRPLTPCGYSLPYNGGGCDTDALIADIEALTGLSLASFDGCYRATTFRLASSATCDPPPPPPPGVSGVIQDCAYGAVSERAARPGSPALYLAGLYETRSDHSPGNHPEGEASVRFGLRGPTVLALSAYEPTHWNVAVAPGAALEKIVAIGIHPQRVTAPRGVVVETYDALQMNSPLAACGYSLPYNGQGCDTDALIANVETVTGLSLTGFDGCYRATRLEYRPE